MVALIYFCTQGSQVKELYYKIPMWNVILQIPLPPFVGYEITSSVLVCSRLPCTPQDTKYASVHSYYVGELCMSKVAMCRWCNAAGHPP